MQSLRKVLVGGCRNNHPSHYIQEASGKGITDSHAYVNERYPDFVQIAKGYGCGGAEVSKRSEFRDALQEMIDYPGPFVLNVHVPYQEHVLPMIPSGHTADDMILE